jgi:hypothetical protein
VAYEPDRNYDIVILDRVLHMLSDDGSRTAVLEKVCSHTKPGGFVLIADTPKQKPFLNAFFDNQGHNWQRYWQRKNFLFMQNSQD